MTKYRVRLLQDYEGEAIGDKGMAMEVDSLGVGAILVILDKSGKQVLVDHLEQSEFLQKLGENEIEE